MAEVRAATGIGPRGAGLMSRGRLGGIGPRERRWLLAFLVLGSAYFAVLLIQMASTSWAASARSC